MQLSPGLPALRGIATCTATSTTLLGVGREGNHFPALRKPQAVFATDSNRITTRPAAPWIVPQTMESVMAQSTAGKQGFVEEVELQGHIIDSLLLPKVLDEILTHGGSYVIKDIRIGQRQTDPSYARIEVRADSAETLRDILDAIHDHGAAAGHRPRLSDRRRRHGRRLPRGLLQHHQLPHAGAPRRRVDRRGRSGDGLRHPGRCRGHGRPAASRWRTSRKGDRIVVGRQGLRVFPAETMARQQPVRVHGQPGFQREAQGRDRARDRRRHEAHQARPARRSWPCSVRPSSTPAASSTSAS